MLANSWHMSLAVVILAFVLQWAQGQAFSIPPPVHESAIQQAIRLGNCSMARPGPCFNAEESRCGLARTCGTTGAQQSGSAIQLCGTTAGTGPSGNPGNVPELLDTAQ